MASSLSRRKFVKASTAVAGLTMGATLLGGCTSSAASSATTSTQASTSASVSSSEPHGHHGHGAPRYQRAMNKAEKIDVAPDESEALAKFVVVSDSHLSFVYTEYIDRVQNMFEDIAEFCPDYDAIIVNGDITNTGATEEYQKFAELAEASGISYPEDFVLAIGNHDQYSDSNTGPGPSNLTSRFREQIGLTDQIHPYYDRTINGVHLIIMGPDHYPDNGWDKFGVSEEEITWLDDLVNADLRNEQLSLVFMHEPLYETVRNTQPGDWGHEWSLSDDDNTNLHECIRRHPNIIFFTGHTHALPDVVQLEQDEPLYVGTGAISYCVDDEEDDSTGNDDISEYGSLGWEVTVWTTCIRFRLRDFLNHSYTDVEGGIYQF